MTDRESRESNTRSTRERKKDWVKPSMLDTPEHNDPDMQFRWVRRELVGETQEMNVINRVRQGYEPVKSEDYPEFEVTHIEGGKHDGIISAGDLILMDVHKDVAKQRNDYYEDQALQLQRAVDLELEQQSHEHMPVNRDGTKSEVAFGNRNNDVIFQGDDSKT